jgi:hypothetical protein
MMLSTPRTEPDLEVALLYPFFKYTLGVKQKRMTDRQDRQG